MVIDVRTRNIERSDRYREVVERETREALSRFGDRVRRVSVTLADINGPRGGRDKSCTIKLVGRLGRRPLIASAVEATERDALDRALARTVRTADRRIERAMIRRHTVRRPSVPGNVEPNRGGVR